VPALRLPHRRPRERAEEFVEKPFEGEDLLSRVRLADNGCVRIFPAAMTRPVLSLRPARFRFESGL
jgi:hypothetical protein